jgi:hypothetical protein
MRLNCGVDYYRSVIARLLVALGIVAGMASPSAQSDLDAFMARVLERRDENWKKLQQYILEEREAFQVIGAAGAPLYGFRREYAWFVREGFFIRSPLRADGVAIGDDERGRAEDEWLRRERRRERRRGERDNAVPPAGGPSGSMEDVLRQSVEPRFVSAAYFLRFTFDPGQYALAGRESLDGRDVLRIEYYPTRMFVEGRMRPNRRLRERDPDVQDKLNKSALVTLWVDQAAHQILRYEFTNIDLDFLPARALVRVDAIDASMHMGQPFPGVWLPRSVGMRFDLTLATGAVKARYDVEYDEYRLATVTTRVR